MKEQLQTNVLAELYSSSLVNIAEDVKPKAVIKTPQPGKQYSGNYEKKILVLVNEENTTYLSDDNLEFLTGILKACKLNLAHIALMNFKNTPQTFQQLKQNMQPQYLLLFGLTTSQIELPFAMPDYQVQQYSNCIILTAPSLQWLNKKTSEAKNEKAKLWKSLQKMLDLK